MRRLIPLALLVALTSPLGLSARAAVTGAPALPSAVYADYAGAVGNGTTDDTSALRRALATGKHLELTRGKTYLYSGTLTLADGQTLRGNGAVLKRANQVVTTTTGNVAIGGTTIPVASLTGLAVGKSVTVATGVTLPTTGARIVTAGTGYVDGETVTVTGGLAPGGTAATGHITASGGAITGLVIDTAGSGYVASPAVTINTVAGAGGAVVPGAPTPVYDPRPHQILSISGNTLTVLSNFTVGFSSGAAVYTTWFGITSSGNGASIRDLRMDGNRANWTFHTWDTCTEIEVSGSRNTIERCYLYSVPGDGIVPFGDYSSIRDCWLENLNGNGIHLSGAVHPVVSNCRVRNANGDPSVGHADGCIIWSNSISDATITGNYCENGICGIGSIDTAGNSDVTISGNTIRNCTSYGIEGNNNSASDVASRVLIIGNRIYSSGLAVPTSASGGIVVYSAGTSASCRDWLIQGNYLESCGIGILSSNPISSNIQPKNLSLRGNHFKSAALVLTSASEVTVDGNSFDWTGNTTAVGISVNGNLTRSKITNNRFLGADYGISGGSVWSDVDIRGNSFLDQNHSGVTNGSGSACPGLLVADNVINNTSASHSAWAGLSFTVTQATVSGNVVNSAKGNAGILINASSNIVQRNTVRGSATRSIWILAGTSNVVTNNTVSAAPTDGGTTTVLRDNDVTP